jgi:hypothetical protein
MSLTRSAVLAAAQDPHAGHHMSPPSPPAPAPAPPAAPADTLRVDGLDAPASTSVEEASRAQPGHVMDHGTYVHRDVGRDASPSPSPHPAEHHH